MDSQSDSIGLQSSFGPIQSCDAKTMKASLPVVVVLLQLVAITTGCKKPESTQQMNPAQNPPPNPFQKEIYSASDRSKMVSIISGSEIEISHGGKTVVCEYAEEDDIIRAVGSIGGDKQVFYFKREDEGLRDQDSRGFQTGPFLYNKSGLEKLAERQKKEQELARIAEEKRVKAEAEELKLQQQEVGASVKPTKSIQTFELKNWGEEKLEVIGKVEITDVSFTITFDSKKTGPFEDGSYKKEIPFRAIWDVDVGDEQRCQNSGETQICHIDINNPEIINYYVRHTDRPPQQIVTFVDPKDDFERPEACQEARKFGKALKSAVESWQTRFPRAVLKRPSFAFDSEFREE